ncbi:MAG: chorismate mutase [Candidatus Neomarinimicrobiota bacterium]|jgi:monofunctional chorismate mutase|nr:chorismate mutase [Candidatus Neomarinimicrobiota bacterium]
MNKDIETIREKIDTIDKEVFQLLINRLNAVTDIGEIKKQEGLPILDEGREQAIYNKIDSLFSEKEATFLKNIYQSIITESKKAEE